MPNDARIVHNFVSTKPTRSDPTRIYGEQWNEDHVITGLEQVDNTSDATKWAAVATLTNKSIDGASNTLTNVPASSLSGLSANMAAWLASASSANLRAAMTDETGTGALYFANGALGTPASGTLTNATGLPLSTGITGAGTGVLTGLAVNVGTAGAVVINGGALGTPSSGTLTNATGLPVSTGISGLATGVAAFLATPSSANLRAALTDEVGTGSAYFVGGALGTPASATLTNATGLPLTGLTTQAAYTIVANNSGSSAIPTAISVPAITSKASPALADIVLIQDSAASNAFKQTTVGAISAAGSVSALNGQTIGGRLTLTSGVAVTVSDVTGATNIYYTPATGNQILIYDGTNFIPTLFSELTLALTSNSGFTNYQQSGKNFDLFVYNDTGTIRLGSSPSWNAGAVAGSDTARGTGAGSTDLQSLNGIWTNKNSITLRFGSATGNTTSVAANRATYVGTFRPIADGQAADTNAKRFLYNAYNQAQRPLDMPQTTNSWASSGTSFRYSNGDSTQRVEIVIGLGGCLVDVINNLIAVGGDATFRPFQAGIGLDSGTVISNNQSGYINLSNAVAGSLQSFYKGYPGLGWHYLSNLEAGPSVAGTIFGNNASAASWKTGISGTSLI